VPPLAFQLIVVVFILACVVVVFILESHFRCPSANLLGSDSQKNVYLEAKTAALSSRRIRYIRALMIAAMPKRQAATLTLMHQVIRVLTFMVSPSDHARSPLGLRETSHRNGFAAVHRCIGPPLAFMTAAGSTRWLPLALSGTLSDAQGAGGRAAVGLMACQATPRWSAPTIMIAPRATR
jgi:hypothetical protein